MDEAPLNTPSLEPWIEPEISELDIVETHRSPNRGGDGNAVHADCTRS